MEWVSFWKVNGMRLNSVLLILSKMRKGRQSQEFGSLTS